MEQHGSSFRYLRPPLFACVALFVLIGSAQARGENAADSDNALIASQFTFANVDRRAAELAAKPFEADLAELPDVFHNLSYDQYRDIRFRKEKSLWHDEGLPFMVQFFHRGFQFKDRVTVNVIDQGKVEPVPFQFEMFDYGKNALPVNVPPDLGFAGLRLHFPLNRDDVYDEVIVFLGTHRDRGKPHGFAPPTPPGIGVRTMAGRYS